jgi:peptidoglycan/LPS O-acetylase OafA/YrhL
MSAEPLATAIAADVPMRDDGDLWRRAFAAKLDAAQIPALDGLRAVAVWLVVTFHFGEGVNGALGVEMFFTLSGFLITLLLLREHERTGAVSLKDFYIRRTRRIFPALYGFVALGTVIYLVRGHEVPWHDVIASLLYVENYHEAIAHTRDSFVGHTWSLGIEEQFYLLWPLLMLGLRHDLRRLTWALAAVIGLSWAWRMVLQYGLQAHQGYIYHAFETRMDQLAIGCLLAVLLKRFPPGEAWRAILSNPWAPALVIAAIAVSSLFHGQVHYRYPLAYTIEPALTALLIAMLIAQSGHPVWRLFDHAAMRFLGRISYSVYLYQQLTLDTARRLTEHTPVLVQYAFAWAVTIAFALASYHFVEQPLRVRRRAG